MHRLSVLGSTSFEGPDGPLTGPAGYRHSVALLAILAMAGERPVSREKLAVYLWPNRDGERARHSLSNAIHVLRQELGESSIVSLGDDLRLADDAIRCDAIDFERAIESGDDRRAVDLYGGPFLDGFHLDDAEEFERWLDQHRTRLEREATNALERLASSAMQKGDWPEAIRWWDSIVDIDPYASHAVLGAMTALAATGNRAEALHRADAHGQLLAEELGAEPDPNVAGLATELREAPPGWTPSWPDRPATGDTRRRGDPRATRRPAFRLATVSVVLATIVVIGGYFTVRGRAGLDSSTAAPTGPAPAIAILPFAVQGDGLDMWREGLVDLLSVNLDDVTGLRAIDSRTVLARWREARTQHPDPELPVMLDVARRSEARYALIGSVVSGDPGIRLVASVYDVEARSVLGHVQVEGVADSLFSLVDRLSIKVLSTLPRRHGGAAHVDLASITTSSVPALVAYLEGERLYRKADFWGAVAAYERAIAADSTFALAYTKLGYVYGWTYRSELIAPANERAFRLRNRLSERSALIVESMHGSVTGRNAEGLAANRALTRKYPDDPQGWDLLGDFIYHYGGALLIEPGEGRAALARAIQLDPGFAPPYVHSFDTLMRLGSDSATVGELLDRYERAAPGTPHAAASRAMYELAFGDQTSRDRALATLDTLSHVFLSYFALWRLSHPRFLDDRISVLELALKRPSEAESYYARVVMMETLLMQGRPKAAMELLDDPIPLELRHLTDSPQVLLYYAYTAAYPVPTEELDRHLAPAPEDSLSRGRCLVVGAWAIERGRDDTFERKHAQLRALASREAANGNLAEAEYTEGAARALEGFAAWKAGRLEDAAEALDEARLRTTLSELDGGYDNRITRWWLAQLSLERETFDQARQYFMSLAHGAVHTTDPIAVLHLAQVQEELGEFEAASQNYAYFVDAWEGAEPEVESWVEVARQGLTRTAGLREE